METKIQTQTFYPSQKINSKWSTDLNLRYKTINLLEDSVENLGDLRFGDDSSATTPNHDPPNKELIPGIALKSEDLLCEAYF